MLATRPISLFTVFFGAARCLYTADNQVYPASPTSPAEHDFRAQASLPESPLTITLRLEPSPEMSLDGS